MRFDHVCLEAFGHALPESSTSSEELELQIAPVYDRLNLNVGRLELMSGIQTRRFWPAGTRPSTVAARAGADALARSQMDPDRIGLLIHTSVCRDFLEPATASVVHHTLGLPPTCQAFDLSNACLGFANGMTVAAGMLERGEIEAALIVAGEDGGPLVRETLRVLSAGEPATRKDVKRAYASLTIGSGAAAVVMTRDTISKTGKRFLGSVSLADTQHHGLCSGDHSATGSGPLMDTDSEALLVAGNALAARTWQAFLAEMSWTPASADRFITHQVGTAHKRLLFETLELDRDRDFPTVHFLGNIGSVSLPITFDLAERDGFITAGQTVALMGIGSGLHCSMLAIQW